MLKDKDILIRIDKNLKTKVKEKANLLGLSVSSYVRMLLKKETDAS